MPIAHVQTVIAGADPGGTTISVVMAAIGAGQRLLVARFLYSGGSDTRLSGVAGSNSGAFARKGGFDDGAGSGFAGEEWWVLAPSGGGAETVTGTFGASQSIARMTVSEYSGNALTSVPDKFDAVGFTSTATPVTPSVTPDSDGQIIIGWGMAGDGSPTWAPGSGYTERAEDTSAFGTYAVEDQVQATAAAITADFTLSAAHSGLVFISTYRAATGITRIQEGFRFRNDDGSETTATWKDAQDTHVTSPLTTNNRLRLLIDGTGDPPGTQFRLDYKKSTDSEYIPVLITQPSAVPPSKIASVPHTTPANPTVTFDITIPSVQIDDLLIVEFISRDHTSGTAQPTVTDNDGGTWIQKGFSTTRKLQIWYRRATAATSAKVITIAGCVGSCTGMLRVLRGVLLTGDPITDLVFEANISGNEAHAGFTPSFSDSLIVLGVGNATNDTLLITTLAAATLGTFEPEDVEDDSTGGSDCYLITSARPSPGGPTNTGGFTWAQATNSATESYTYAVRPSIPVVHPILLSPSTNIAASGEATTAQLTPPSGKSTSDFVAGRMQDDENPADSVDVTTDDYTELEWCLTAVSGTAVNGDIYQFRATIAGVPLDTYAVTPEWTIGTPSAGGGQPPRTMHQFRLRRAA